MYVIILLLVAFVNGNSQDCHTFEAKAPAYVLLQDTAIHITHDTTMTVCESYILLTQQNGYNFYNKLIAASDKHLLLKDIYRSVLSNPPPDTLLEKKNMMNAEDVYQAFSGKPISNIRIQVLKPFGPTINDTTRPAITYLEKALNPTHINTHDYVIRKKLLFEKNDTVNPLLMVENARILSNMNYLQDASIIVMPSKGDSVEVLVLVKDKFPWLAIPNVISSSDFSLFVKQGNIMGLGQSAGMELTVDASSTPKFYMSEWEYSVNNVYKQVNAYIGYQVSNNSQKNQFQLNRQLVPTKVNLGGGLEISQNAENIITDPTHIDRSLYYFKYMYYDAWASYLIPLDKIIPQVSKSNVYFIPGIRISKENYSERPEVTLDTNSQFFNYDYVLSNLVIAKQEYFRTNYLLNFGRAEYLPYGFQASITAGYSWTEFMQKPYIGFGASSTWHFNNIGFVFAKIDVGTHFTGDMEQGAASMSLVHLTDLMKKGRHKLRIKTDMTLTSGINRFSNDLLYLGEQYGFIGLSKETYYGQQRAFLESTVIDYTPYYLFGFRVAFIGFASVGTIGPQYIPLKDMQLLTSFGLGAYIQNDFLVFSSFQIKVAYFPVTPNGINHIGFSFVSANLLDNLDFLFTKPQQVKYK